MLGIWPLSGQFISLSPTNIWGWVIPCALQVGLCSLGASNTPPDPLSNCDHKRLPWMFPWKAEWPQLRTTSLSRGGCCRACMQGGAWSESSTWQLIGGSENEAPRLGQWVLESRPGWAAVRKGFSKSLYVRPPLGATWPARQVPGRPRVTPALP